MTEKELRQDITKAVKKGWITKGGFMTDVAVDEVYKMLQTKSPFSDDNELKRLIWEEWEGEIKEEDPREVVFKYMVLMRESLIGKQSS